MGFKNLSQMLGVIDQYKARVKEAQRLASYEVAEQIAEAARKNASGRPGPNVKTGRLRAGIVVQPTPNGARVTASSVPYDHRIERRFPFFRPAVEEVKPRARGVFAQHINKARPK